VSLTCTVNRCSSFLFYKQAGKITSYQPIILYRKFIADNLFTGNEILPAGNVLITDEQGIVVSIVNEQDAGDNIETFKGILTPGFVNCHCHIELSHMKGTIPEKTGLVNFVQQVMKKRNENEPQKQSAMLAAEQELSNSGTIAIADICNTTDSIALKQQSKLHWYNFIETTGFVDAAAEKRFVASKEVLIQFQLQNARSQSSLSPHAPYSVSKTLFRLLNKETSGQLITIHNQESGAEDELYKNKTGEFLNLYKNFGIDIADFQPTGKSSLQSWFPYFTNHQSIILVHNTFITEDDILKTQNPVSKIQNFFCLCVNANKYIEQKMPPIDLLRRNQCNIVIGTDSYASNRQLNMLEELKSIQNEPASSIPLQEILKWATLNGATALQMQDKLGSFEKGKRPGIVLIDEVNDLNLTKKSIAKRIL
jgi:cytosine/adenosine deaminase-related metal-dependent hydrolase